MDFFVQDPLCCVGLAGTRGGGMVVVVVAGRAVDILGKRIEQRRQWKRRRHGHAGRRLPVALALGGRGGCVCGDAVLAAAVLCLDGRALLRADVLEEAVLVFSPAALAWRV